MRRASGVGTNEAARTPHAQVLAKFKGHPVLEQQISTTPGIVEGYEPPSKPGPEDTPYRSRLYRLASMTADGNDYKPGDPIPLAEAELQGIVGPNSALFDTRRETMFGTLVGDTPHDIVRENPVAEQEAAPFKARDAGVCMDCEGRGHRRGKSRSGEWHTKPDCKCVACRTTCKACGGTGREGGQ